MVVREDGRVELPEPPAHATPLGLRGVGGMPPTPYRVAFAPGDQVLFYTDGVTEARDASGAFYPLAQRAALLMARDAQHGLEELRADLVRYAGGPPHDDVAMVLVRRSAAGPGEVQGAPAVR
ncbi:hypothetical protein Sm713_48120 [Streptomyces sp. TS71-3]|nr:hypothetical protein Sm713_48120 [Streptomyces sp. TS71-3]